jgi:membrane protease YdiL (CAAX protease family)
MERVMPTIEAFIKRHPVLSYYVLAFAISWGAMLLVIGGPVGIPATPKQMVSMMGPVVAALMAGPSVAGLLLTSIVDGRAGLRALFSRLRNWRVEARWYAVALLAAPVVTTVLLLALAIVSPLFLPGIVTAGDRASLLVLGIAVGLVGGFCEELGWTGFAIPKLRLTHSVLSTGLIVGVLWGVWHFLVNFWSSGNSSGALSTDLLVPSLIFSVGILPVFRVLMVWVYDHTGSLLVAMLMHAGLIFSTLFVLKPAVTGAALSTYYVILTAVLWVVVAAVAAVNRGTLEAGGRMTVAHPKTAANRI